MVLMESKNARRAGWILAQVNIFGAYCWVLKVDHKPGAKPVKNNFIKIFALQLPILEHARWELFPLHFRDKKRAWIIVCVAGPSLEIVHHMLRPREPGTLFLWLTKHVTLLIKILSFVFISQFAKPFSFVGHIKTSVDLHILRFIAIVIIFI